MAGRKRLPDIMGEALGWLENDQPIVKGKSPLPEIQPAPQVEPLPGAKVLAIHPPPCGPDPKLVGMMERLKLKGMSQAFKELSGSPLTGAMGFEELLFVLLDAEETERKHRSLLNRLGKARLHYDEVTLEDLDQGRYSASCRKRLQELGGSQWLELGQDVVFQGALGSGKTYLACALVRQACEKGFNALYRRLGSMMRELAEARKDDRRFQRLRKLYARADLLVLDDWGLERLPSWQSLDLFRLLEERHGRKSTLLASSMPRQSWPDIWDEAPLPGTIVSELLSNAVERLSREAISLELDDDARHQAMGD